MISQPQDDISLMRGAAGLAPVSSSPNQSSGTDMLSSLHNSIKNTSTASSKPTSLMSDLGNDLGSAVDNLKNEAASTRQDIQNAGGGIGANIAGVAQMTGNLAGQVGGTILKGATDIGRHAINALNGDNGETLNTGIQNAMNATDIFGNKNSHDLKVISDFIKQGADSLPPNVVQSFQNFLNTAGLMGGGKLADMPVEDALNAVKSIPGKVADTVSGAVDAVKGKVTGAFKGKTVDEILATPEEKLAKLSPEDRKTYFDAQREQVSQTHSVKQEKINQKQAQMETEAKAQAEKNTTALNNETQGLVNQADRASIEEAQSLKPKVVQAMGKNSKTYRDLVDKEISQHADVKVAPSEMRKFVDSRFSEDPTKAAQIKDRLGITEPKGETQPTGMTVAEEKPVTIGQIYDQTKSLRQDIGTAAKKGSRVFSPDEMTTDNAISTLSDFMKSKGVDLTEANKFWSQYAPMRDKLIKTIQPFTPRGAESGTFNTFTKDIQNYVNGVKEGKTDFIQATEKILKTKIGNSETRAALGKLSANEKAKFAVELEKQQKISDAQLLRDQEMKDAETTLSQTKKGIDDKEFEANRQATTRANIIKALKKVGITIGVGAGAVEAGKQLGL